MKLSKRAVSALLIAAMLFPLASCSDEAGTADTQTETETVHNDTTIESIVETLAPEENDEPKEYVPLPEIDEWNGQRIKSSGKNDSAATFSGDNISLIYDEEKNKNVLSVGDGGCLLLPAELFKNTKEGFTVYISVMPEKSGGNIFQTNLSGYKTGDTSWYDAPEISFKTTGELRIFAGGRTINGVYNAAATYNNGGAGDDKAYAEPRGHKTRYAADTSIIPVNKWSVVALSFTKDKLTVYINGKEISPKIDSSLGGNLASTIEYLFGDYNNGEYILGDYVNSSIGNSVYGDTPAFIGKIDEFRFYERALTSDEIASLPKNADYVWDFDSEDIITNKDDGKFDVTKYYDGTSLSEGALMIASSPDSNTVFSLRNDADGRFFYSVMQDGEVMIENSMIGFTLSLGRLYDGLSLVEGSTVTKEINETYKTLTGYGEFAEDHCNETTFTLKNSVGSFDFTVRLYNDGFAYRYSNVTAGNAENITVSAENSEFVLPSDAISWSHNLNGTYEAEFVKRTGIEFSGLTAQLSTPMLVKNGSHLMLLTEAAVFNNNGDYPSSALSTESGTSALRLSFGLDRDPNRESTGELDSPGHINITRIKTRNGFSTPWRVAIISDDYNEFCGSSMISDLNPAPDKELFADTSYIEPGRVAWSWWSEDGEQDNYDKHIEYIDFAAENGWEYVCLDAYWRAFEKRLPEMCKYAEDKGVGLFVWVNYRDIKDLSKMEKLFSSWAEAGVRGIKSDYFESDAQNVLLVMEEAAKCAARHKLMILYHGCVRPAGEFRTYPNIMTTEAVLGEEAHKWSALPTIENCLIYPFSRNICGSMDYTPAATRIAANSQSYGFGLAMTVVYESSLQHLAYSAHGYKTYAGLSFLNNLSTVWDESHLIEGEPAEFVTFARRSGEDWYIGSMTNDAREASVTLDFLASGEYNAYIYGDDKDGTKLVIEQKKVKKGDTLTLSLIEHGGAAVIITKNEIDTSIGSSGDIVGNYYEAESSINTLRGTAVRQSSAFCSGGEKVGYVGNGAGNTLTFNGISVEKDGKYSLTIHYCCGEYRKVIVTVNGKDEYEVKKMNSGDYSRPASITVEIELKAGENTITFSQPSYYAPDIDKIEISEVK